MLTNQGELVNLPEIAAFNGLPGSIRWTKFGFGIVGTTFNTIFSAGANPGLYQYLAVPGYVGVASTDPDDTLLGSGANLVSLQGLCENGCLHEEIIELSGQTPKSTVTMFSRVFRIINISRTGHDIQGQLYAGPIGATWVGGEPSQILAHVNNGYNQTQMALYTVPKDYYLFVYDVVVSSSKGKDVEVAVFARDANIKDLSQSGAMAVKINWLLYESPLVIPLGSDPFVFPELTDFEFRAKADLATTKVTANAQGVLIPKRYIDRPER